MKYLLIILCFLALKSQAQYTNDTLPWCPPGASWIFENAVMGAGYFRNYYEIKYESDTIIASKPCKKLSFNGITLSYSPGWVTLNNRYEGLENYIYMYESKDSIYKYNDSVAQFEFLYSFNALPGEYFVIQDSLSSCFLSLGVTISLPSTDTLYVLNLSQDTFSQHIFRTINYSTGTYYSYAYNGYKKIINKIGPLDAPFPKIISPMCNLTNNPYSYAYNLLCYYDSLRGFVEFNTSYANCHTIRTSISEGKDEVTYTDGWIKVYPNPTNEILQIQSNDYIEVKKIIIKDIFGKTIVEQNSNDNSINISKIPPALYIVDIYTKTKTISLKFIKI